MAQALHRVWGTDSLYVADLDAIGADALNVATIQGLVAAGFELLLDAGVNDRSDAARLFDLGVQDVVVGLESLPHPQLLRDLLSEYGSKVVFSLDLKANWPMTAHGSPWSGLPPLEVARLAMAEGVQRMIVLDLHGVGRSGGVSTLPLCKQLLQEFPQLRLITGGGVRGRADLESMQAAGIHGALVASALHDGRLEPRPAA